MSISKGDRVKVIQTLKEGEVIEEIYDPILIASKPRMKVKLASGESGKFSEDDLELVKKKPRQEDAIEAVDKIQQQLSNIPNLPKREKEELPNHLKYLKEDIQANNSNSGLNTTNLNYVKETLAVIKKANPKDNCLKDIASNLDLIDWWARTV
jgi:hypothetical protein